jgi:hypothetical protein
MSAVATFTIAGREEVQNFLMITECSTRDDEPHTQVEL